MTEIIGTIISSVLDYDNLIRITGDPRVIEPRRTSQNPSKWIPADGRSINNSALHEATGIEKAPDLRGKFLRGLNIIYGDNQPDFDQSTGDPEGDNRHAGSYQPDAFKEHSHNYILSGIYNNADSGNERSYRGADNNSGSVSPTGGSETRPKNIAVYFYIKIN